MNRNLCLGALGAAVLMLGGCTASLTTNTSTTATSKSPASSSPATGGSSTPAAATPGTTSTAKKTNEKKPPASKTIPVPADWITMSDDVKGYEFLVPKGTEHSTQTVNGIDVYIASVPEPNKIGVMVLAFKNKNLTKDDLLKSAQGALEGMGEKNVKVGEPTELSADYSVATYTSIDEKGKPGKGKVLVGTDVTDNYVMLVGTDADQYDANEKTIDEIWGSFGMYSGGASGAS
jgi:ABC-type phosphate transport system substrate-binding protein